MLAAFLMSASYFDHWTEYFGWTHDDDSSPGAVEIHQGHCHLNPSTCSDQPLPPGPKMTWEIVEVKEPNLPVIVAPGEPSATVAGFVTLIPTDPPRSV